LHEKHPHICVLKESGASCDRVSDLVCRFGNDFVVLSGEDNLILPYMSVGAKGVICTTSNVLPREMVKMVTLALNNDFAAARAIHQQYFPIFKALFVEPNPVPAKYALHKMKVIPSAEVRAPLCGMTSENQKMMDRVLESFGLIGKKGA
ncbi:MAG TPA: dihydrodipicolinate synthase family protein, partial [Opitutales bacterium]|nr:dihydrodipicolinate synthase family protein [Opitutales bacterium]